VGHPVLVTRTSLRFPLSTPLLFIARGRSINIRAGLVRHTHRCLPWPTVVCLRIDPCALRQLVVKRRSLFARP
jgi:hypothetical protein